MRPLCVAVVSCTLVLATPGHSQQTQNTDTQPTPVKDPQAMSVVNQALAVAGGLAAITAIDDYTATGTVTYHGTTENAGPVTVREAGLTDLRLDAQLSGGIRSLAMYDGQIRIGEGGVTTMTWGPPPFYAGRIVVPTAFLAAASVGPQFNLAYRGTQVIDGRVAFDVEIQPVVPVPEAIRYRYGLMVHLFVDAGTLQVVMMEDVDPQNHLRQVRYSDYREVSGTLVPFAISEQIANHQTWTIQLSQINFNTGLQDSDFQL